MKGVAMIVFGLFAAGLLAFVVMAVMSQKLPKDLGLLNGALKPCPDSPNCVCSEDVGSTDPQYVIKPIQGDLQTWLKLKKVVVEQGGLIQVDADDYIHATFTSSILRYVDDMECRFDRTKKLIHMRSASRMGHSDFGVNRKRVLAIQRAL